MGLEFSLSLGWHAHWDACREPGKRWSSLQSCLSASPWGQANICRLLMREVQASHSSPVTPKCPLTSQGGSNPTRPQDQSTRSVALTTHSPPVYSPFSSKSSSRDTSSDPIASLLFLPDYMYIFLTVLVVQVSFHQFPGSFQWNFSTCKCIFDVLIEGSWVLHPTTLSC